MIMKIRPGLAMAVSALAVMLSAPVQAADIIVTNATLFDGTGSDPVKNANIIIEDGRIKGVEIGDTSETATLVIDAGGKTVMPGLINAHFHLFFDFYSSPPVNPATSDETAEAYIRDVMPGRLQSHLEQGITSLFSPIDYAPHIFNLRDQVASGEISGPRLFISGPILMHSGNHYACSGDTDAAKAWCNERISLPIDTPDQARASVQKLVSDGADVLVFDAVSNQETLQKDAFSAMIDEAHRLGKRIVSHNLDARDVPFMLEAGIDGFIHAPSLFRDTDGTLLTEAGKRGLPLPATLGFYQRYIAEGHANSADIEEYETQKHNIELMYAAGATPLFASDMPGLPAPEVVPTVTGVMSGLGLDNKTILLSATRNVARNLLGRDDLGTIEPGQIADLILVDGDPLTDLAALTRVEVVIKDGSLAVDKR
ncbi:amidohydrolase family protein [Xinfangfangia sp. D13-10-4-6]|uniref:amidohydrolase family protein n=1 Tax=Pseudogemmobacter hezensis TaxID=2737662 RepID=UPI001551ABD5|nr:amidohydrolase family protein [Pseudogemmobacter hezensis]NPD14349.1 amidohydrolase family protein [Pseudogemmobacter hezensis]